MPSDESDPPAPDPAKNDLTFPVEYDEFAGQSFAPDARGRGTLVVHDVGASATFTFSGPTQPSLSLGSEIAFTFSAEKIRNVSVRDKHLTFVGTFRQGLAAEQAFGFHCITDSDAAEIARLLPGTKDADVADDDNFDAQLARLPRSRTPWTSVTGLIVIANALVFVAMGLAGAGWITVADMLPYVRYGANHAELTTDGEWWRLVASMFLHYGILHLLLNMWALFQAGQLLERLLGRTLYTFVYFGSGITGSLVSLVWHGTKGAWSAGASGAVFGVYGALVGYMLREKHALPKSVWQPGLKSALSFAGYNLVIGTMLPGIDNSAHVGGFAGGLALGWIAALPLDRDIRRRFVPARLGLGLVALAVAFGLGAWVAPRYDYRRSEEIAWATAFHASDQREAESIAAFHAVLQAHRAGSPNPTLVRLLAHDLIPFNEAWIESLAALPLSPDLRTARRRALALAGLRLRLEAYRHLLTGVEKSDPRALADFQAEMGPVNIAFTKFRAFD